MSGSALGAPTRASYPALVPRGCSEHRRRTRLPPGIAGSKWERPGVASRVKSAGRDSLGFLGTRAFSCRPSPRPWGCSSHVAAARPVDAHPRGNGGERRSTEVSLAVARPGVGGYVSRVPHGGGHMILFVLGCLLHPAQPTAAASGDCTENAKSLNARLSPAGGGVECEGGSCAVWYRVTHRDDPGEEVSPR